MRHRLASRIVVRSFHKGCRLCLLASVHSQFRLLGSMCSFVAIPFVVSPSLILGEGPAFSHTEWLVRPDLPPFPPILQPNNFYFPNFFFFYTHFVRAMVAGKRVFSSF
jgi:hypothetical protein